MALVSNYYIGYMLCIFSVIYFVSMLVLKTPKLQEVKIHRRAIVLYVLSSAAAGGLNAFLLLPTAFSLTGGKAAFDLSMITNTSPNFTFIDVFAKLYTGAFNWEQIPLGLPNIFCGMLILLLTGLYFMNTTFPLKEKLLSAGLLFILLISFQVRGLNLIWHGSVTDIPLFSVLL